MSTTPSPAIEAFRTALRTNGVAADVMVRHQMWERGIAAICAQIETWLDPMAKAGELVIVRNTHNVLLPGTVREAALAGLALRFMGMSVVVVTAVPDPVPKSEVGAYRLRLRCGPRTASLVFTPFEEKWHLGEMSDRREITEELFIAILMCLLQLKELP
jgi:hypothetical protein